jgi:23S rRNA pseudouridine2605 synthase
MRQRTSGSRPRSDRTRSCAATEHERIQKVLAALGLGSRREIERWIASGRVTVNGVPARLGDRLGGGDRVAIDGREVVRSGGAGASRPRVIAYHKPAGELSTRADPQGRPTVFDRLPRLRGARWIAVGRLDLDTSGLMLFTTDGSLARALMHPSTGLRREYAVRVLGSPGPEALAALTQGSYLEDGPARFDELIEQPGPGRNRWYRVSLREGRKREVRRLWETTGCTVSRLIRVRFGPIELPRTLARGRWRELGPEGLDALYRAARLPRPPGRTSRPRESEARTGRLTRRRLPGR